MVFIQDIVRGTELTIASGGPPGGLPAATADPRQTPSPAARLAQARNKIGRPEGAKLCKFSVQKVQY